MRVNIDGAYGELSSLPGCSQVVVSHGVFVKKKARGQGIGSRAHVKRLQLIKSLGYDLAICTVACHNHQQVDILVLNNWSLLMTFENSKTGHIVGLYGRRL